METFKKIKTTVFSSPIGAIVGITGGYLVAKKLDFHKTFTVIPFMVVGAILGSTIGSIIKGKIHVNKNKEFITT